MSRSNPTEYSKNPATRWFEWAGGSDGGYMRWYDKENKTQVKTPLPFTFLLLDELSTVKGWHDASDSGIYANEVRDTRQDVLVVKSFQGGELASGIYKAIRDRVGAQGGHYSASLYIAYKELDALKIGNLALKGATLSEWMEFKKKNPVYEGAVKIAEFEQLKKGATTYRVPKFARISISEETDAQATALDAELQAFLADYLMRPKAEASQAEEEPPPPENAPHFDDVTEDVPF